MLQNSARPNASTARGGVNSRAAELENNQIEDEDDEDVTDFDEDVEDEEVDDIDPLGVPCEDVSIFV